MEADYRTLTSTPNSPMPHAIMIMTSHIVRRDLSIPQAEQNVFSGKLLCVLPGSHCQAKPRHSDHKLEMTCGEFREWALSAASDWG
jgi:hypothetical protein